MFLVMGVFSKCSGFQYLQVGVDQICDSKILRRSMCIYGNAVLPRCALNSFVEIVQTIYYNNRQGLVRTLRIACSTYQVMARNGNCLYQAVNRNSLGRKCRLSLQMSGRFCRQHKCAYHSLLL